MPAGQIRSPLCPPDRQGLSRAVQAALTLDKWVEIEYKKKGLPVKNGGKHPEIARWIADNAMFKIDRTHKGEENTMNRRYRKTVIAGNWKMNMTATETKKFAEELKKIMPRAKWCDTLICVPACNIQTAAKAFKDLRISVGAENVYFEEKGAYTGEVSADMLKDLGVKYVIVGHSERRQYFCETDATVNKKVHAVLNAGMNPIICVGESLEQRETGITDEWIALQVKSALYGVPADKLRRCIIAYEPIWAIGTGKTASAEQAGEVCTNIRATIRSLYGARVARSVTIQYGGSMNPKNAAELLAQPDIDGGLIGGASLKPEQFVDIINAANQE